MDSNSPTSDPRICTVSVPPEPQGSWSENRVCLLPPPSVSLLGFGRGGRFGFFLSPANFVWPPAPCEHLTHTQTPAEEALGKCETQPAPSLGRVHALGYKIIRVSTYVNFYMQPSDGQAPEMPIFPALSHPHVTSTPAHLSHKCTPVPSGG